MLASVTSETNSFGGAPGQETVRTFRASESGTPAKVLSQSMESVWVQPGSIEALKIRVGFWGFL